jgi:hypothetical protein
MAFSRSDLPELCRYIDAVMRESAYMRDLRRSSCLEPRTGEP